MKRAPTVPGPLENAVAALAAQYPSKTHINVYCPDRQLRLHVLIHYRQIISWQVSDYVHPIDQLELELRGRVASRPWELNKCNLLFVWDETRAKLEKRVVTSEACYSYDDDEENDEDEDEDLESAVDADAVGRSH
jgi:hypothetical protein